jgi:hypothetical protein
MSVGGEPAWDTLMYRRHATVTTRAWDRSLARQGTEPRGSVSQYNPHIAMEEIRRIEMSCCRPLDKGGHGTPIGPVRIDGDFRYGSFYYEHNDVIGVSDGEFTKIAFIIVQQGSVHGYPITQAELDRRLKKEKKKRKP